MLDILVIQDWVREAICEKAQSVLEKKMFKGVWFMVAGKMCICNSCGNQPAEWFAASENEEGLLRIEMLQEIKKSNIFKSNTC